MSAFRFDTCMQKDVQQSDCRINNALINSQWRHTDADITR